MAIRVDGAFVKDIPDSLPTIKDAGGMSGFSWDGRVADEACLFEDQMKHRFPTTALMISLLGLACAFQLAAVFAAPGDLDTTFAGTGKYRFGFGGNDDFADAVAVQADGKLVVAGASKNPGSRDFSVVRYNTDGTPDTSFGIFGKVMTTVGTSSYATSVGIQTDGKIVVAGSARNGSFFDFAVVRYNSNGVLDNSFGSGGKVITSTSSADDGANAIAIQADGKIVVVGTANNYYFTVVRYDANGLLDSSFGSGGIVLTHIGQGVSDNSANAIAIQPDGNIVVAGSVKYIILGHSDYDFVVLRYAPNGALDTSFGNSGIQISDFLSRYERAFAVALQISNTEGLKIVVAGTIDNGSNHDFAIVRYTSNGSLDTSFDGDGLVTTDFGSYDSGYAVMIQSSGAIGPIRIVVAGKALVGNHDNFAVAKYFLNGALDTAFDGDGKITTPIGDYSSSGYAMVLQSGKIVVAGYSTTPNIFNQISEDFAVVRYELSNGSLDATFDGDGIRIDDIGNRSPLGARAVAIQPDGKFLLAGSIGGGSAATPVLARYNSNATLDTSFGFGEGIFYDPFRQFNAVAIQTDGKIVVAGGDGFLRYNTDGSFDLAGVASGVNVNAMAIQPDGKLVVAGYSFVSNDLEFAVARFNANGTLDGSFDGDGIVVTPMGTTLDMATALAIQSDGRIVIAGQAGNTFAAARYNPDGSLDTSFNFDGKVTTPVDTSFNGGKALAIQPDGKIVVAGDSALVRYNTDGSLDTSFAGDGIALTTLSVGNGMAIQPDGKILVAGSSLNADTFEEDFAVGRYNADGSLDASYGNGGKVTVDISGRDIGYGVALDSAGNALVVGEAGSLFGVVRLLGDAPECGYGVSPTSQFFTAAGGAGSLNVTTSSACNWTSSAGDTWITITSSESGMGNGVVTYEVRENFTGQPRQATINVAGVNQLVIQDAALGEDCTYSINPQFQAYSGGGGTGVINVIAEERCAWQAVASDSWITITSSDAGIGNGTVAYSVGPNPTSSARNGTITVAGKVFSIKQKRS